MSKSTETNNITLNNTLLIDAVIEENTERVSELLASRVTVDKMNNEGTTALMEASYIGNLEIVKLLLSYNADPTLVDKDGFSSFVWAFKGKNKDVMRELLIKANMWSSNKKISNKIMKETLQNFEVYRDRIEGRIPDYQKMTKDMFNNQQIRKNNGIMKYDSKIYEVGSVTDSFKKCFDHNDEYFAPHDSSHWVKKKKAHEKYMLRNNNMEVAYDWNTGKFSPCFRQYKNGFMCSYCLKRNGTCDEDTLTDKKAMNKIRVFGSPTKRFNNIKDYEVD